MRTGGPKDNAKDQEAHADVWAGEIPLRACFAAGVPDELAARNALALNRAFYDERNSQMQDAIKEL